MKTLVTAFGPFSGVARNPTEIVIQELGRRGLLNDHLSATCLTVSYRLCDDWVEHSFPGPDVDTVLHLGVACRSEQFRMEARALNSCESPVKDSEDQAWETGPIVAGSDESLAATLDAAGAVRALTEKGLPVVLSDDAGGYVCNYLLYRSLLRAREMEHPVRVGVLHVPDLVDGSQESEHGYQHRRIGSIPSPRQLSDSILRRLVSPVDTQ